MAIPQTTGEKRLRPMGVDIGATLAKLAMRAPDGSLQLEFFSAGDLPGIDRRIADLAPDRLGLTGCGASAAAARLHRPTRSCLEFEAWGRGARILLRGQGFQEESPYLLVSLGTGTSILRVEGETVTRLGGTALGGGTLLGLGVALTGCRTHAEICRLAEQGDRGKVDLRVGDIYAEGEIPLPGETTAASFGGLARSGRGEGGREAPSPTNSAKPEDLAAAVIGLVGENVALVCSGIAQAAGISRLVFGGATLLENPALASILTGVTGLMGNQPVLLESGSFAGAVGALDAAAEA